MLMNMLITPAEHLIQLSVLKLDNYAQFQKITGNLSCHYIFPDSLVNSNYVFHYSPVHSQSINIIASINR